MARKLSSSDWLGIGAGDRTAAMLPLHYAAGLKILLLVPAILGGSVAFPPAGAVLEMQTWLPRLQPSYLCTTPTTRARADRARWRRQCGDARIELAFHHVRRFIRAR